MNTENNKNIKLNCEDLGRIKIEMSSIIQNKLATCKAQIAALENEIANKRKVLENTDLSNEQNTILKQKLEEDVTLLKKLYDLREKLENQIENQTNKEKENK